MKSPKIWFFYIKQDILRHARVFRQEAPGQFLRFLKSLILRFTRQNTRQRLKLLLILDYWNRRWYPPAVLLTECWSCSAKAMQLRSAELIPGGYWRRAYCHRCGYTFDTYELREMGWP